MLLATLDRRVKKWVSSYRIKPMTLNNMIFLSHMILLLLPPPLPRVLRLGRQQHDEVLFEGLSYFHYDVEVLLLSFSFKPRTVQCGVFVKHKLSSVLYLNVQ